MGNLNNIKQEISSVNDLQKTVSTMKILAAANIKKFEKIVLNIKKYQSNINLGIQAILKQNPKILNYIKYTENFYNNENNSYNIFIIIGSNNGLCGKFNDRIANFFSDKINKSHNNYIITIGDRINMLIKSKKIQIDQHFQTPNSPKQINELLYNILENINKKISEKDLKKVVIFYTEYDNNNKNNSSISFKKVLPFDSIYFEKLKSKPWPTNNIPYWRINIRTIMADFIQQYIFISIYLPIVSSMAAEQFSRLITLQRSEKNIKERISELNSLYNRTRQNKITSDILDTISSLKVIKMR